MKKSRREIQEYFNNPELNLNAKESKKTITSQSQKKLKEIEEEIKKLEKLVKQQEKPQKKKRSFFARFFLGD